MAPATALTFRRPEDDLDYVTVSDPVIHADGMNKFTSYRVDCRPPTDIQGNNTAAGMDPFLDNNRGRHSAVLRRYSDFLWLYERLHCERAGSIVPPPPEKQAVNRFGSDFVEDRRLGLERFLRRVVLHPELHDAPSLSTFLRSDDHAFQHAKATAAKNDARMAAAAGGDPSGGAGAFQMSPKKAEGIKKWFSEAKTSMSGDLVRSPDDDLFEEIERYVEALSVQMKRVSLQATGLVKKDREIANGMFEFGLAFHQLGQSEGEDLGRKLEWVGGTADAVSVACAEIADAELRGLEEPLRDYIKTVQAVKAALQRRHEKRVSYTALLHEIETREIQVQRLRMGHGADPGGKAYALEMSLQRYRAGADVARDDYAEVSQRVLREVDRFKREKAEEMRAVVLDYIRLQIEANRRMERVWADLVPKLEGTGTEGVIDGRSGAQPGIAPPSMPPPPVPPPTSASSPPSQPVYANVPSDGGAAGGGGDPLGESTIQYRDNNFAGMGI